MTKDLLQLQKFIEGSDIIHETDGAITFVLHDLFKLKKDGSPRSKVKLFAFLPIEQPEEILHIEPGPHHRTTLWINAAQCRSTNLPQGAKLRNWLKLKGPPD